MKYQDCKFRDEKKLQDWAREFKKKKQDAKRDQDSTLVWKHYLGANQDTAQKGKDATEPPPLLAAEMRVAHQDGRVFPCENPNEITLVMLLGESFEPLLQTIWAYRPKRLVPIVNSEYVKFTQSDEQLVSGKAMWTDFEGLLPRMRALCGSEIAAPTTDKKVLPKQQLVCVEETPNAVFEHLREALRTELADPNHPRIVVDITGAKKTMVTGAFLFAAYANLDISYMDFSRVDEDGKPLSYSCCMNSEVNNPLKDFGIFEWEHAGAAYRDEDFHAVKMRLADLPTELQNTELENFIRMCELWRDRDFVGAAQEAETLSEETRELVPRAIKVLRGRWILNDTNPLEFFLLDPRAVLVYANDELKRIQHLHKPEENRTQPDLRASFTRAYALHETLLKARVFALLQKNLVNLEAPPPALLPLGKFPKEYSYAILKWMIEKLTAALVRDALSNPSFVKRATVLINGHPIRICISRDWHPIPSLAPTILRGDAVRDKRNAITHSYIQVTPDDANDAIGLVKANLENYRTEWATLLMSQEETAEFAPAQLDEGAYHAPSWDELLQVCGLGFVLIPKYENEKGNE